METPSAKHNIILVILILFTSVTYAQIQGNRLFNDSTLKISEIRTNSIHSDFGPSVIHDTLYFTTFNDKLMGKTDKVLKKKKFYDLYQAQIDSQGDVIGERQPINEFATRYNEGPVSWCEKTGELFVTQNYADQSAKLKPFQKEINRLKIVIAKHINGKWKYVADFPYNNSQYSVGHPALTESGDTIIFASDMPGGYGATDLYMSVRKNGNWDTPVNLGPQINTSGKDEFPFITGNSYSERFLIFASTGHNSRGGFDLFFTRLNDKKDEVHQFSEPINGVNDDFSMHLPDNVEFGYVTSNRPGTGSDDIYKLTFDKYISYLQQIFVFDVKTLKPISGAHVDFCKRNSGETNSEGEISFLFEKNAVCNVTASAVGYKDNSKLIKIGKPIQGSILKDTIFLEMIVNEKIVLRNIYYDFDKWDILPDAANELDRLASVMRENHEMKVELSAHTDARGTSDYNLKLSQKRAQAAVDYIISKGIDKARITGKGYGESQLINKCNKDCTPVQHRENRRTEIYIPGFLRGEPVKQTVGDYSNGQPDHSHNYSSYKQHGSIFAQTTNLRTIGTNVAEFSLILGSFNDTINASKVVQQLKADGFEAIILNDSEPVRVGNRYQSFGQARKALDSLESKSYIGWIIQTN